MKLIRYLFICTPLAMFMILHSLAQADSLSENTLKQGLATAPVFVEKLAKPDLTAKLRKGGFILYIRHGYTDNSKADDFPFVDLDDCNTQRVLSDQGRALMKQVGISIRGAKIPIGEIFVSPMCRTKESAQLAFGNKFKIDESLIVSANLSSSEKKPLIEGLRKLFEAPVQAGTNRVIISHAPNLADLTGYFVKPEGTVVVFEQSGNAGYHYVASIPPDLWNSLKK